MAAQPLVESALAALITILILYLLGVVTSRMMGKQILIGLELLLERLPVLKAIQVPPSGC